MNKHNTSNYAKMIAFFMIAVSLLSVLAVSADGWQNDSLLPSEENQGSNDQSDNTPPSNAEEDNTQKNEPIKYYHHITGKEISENECYDTQVAYIIDSNSPLYGINECNILIEFPIENKNSRFVVIRDQSENISKIGSLTYSRHYMTNLSKVFGATVVSLENDDTISYDHIDISSFKLDLAKNKASYYTEYTYFKYTNTYLLNDAFLGLSNVKAPAANVLPYQFASNTDTKTAGIISAESIVLPYDTTTMLTYSVNDKKYVLNKMGSDKIDISTPDQVGFDNVLILFADSMTYETADSTQLVMNTIGSGAGYYANGGTAQKIFWSLDINGNMSLVDESGNTLIVERGNFYIGYVKSSMINHTIFS